MFHLHRLEHHQPLSRSHPVALGHIDRDDLAWHRGEDSTATGRRRAAAAAFQRELETLTIGKDHRARIFDETCGMRGAAFADDVDRAAFALVEQGRGDPRIRIEPETDRAGGVLLDRVEDRKVGGSLPDRIIRRIVADQPVELAFDESGVELGFDEIVFQQGVGEEGGVGLHRPDLDAFGDIGQGLDRVRPGLFPHDELGDHGIVMR